MTDAALEEMKKVLDANDAAMVRVAFAGMGWGGPSFGLALEKSVKDNDEVFEYDGLKVVVSKDYSNMYKSLVVDWVNNNMGKGFTIAEKDADGCGGCSGSC